MSYDGPPAGPGTPHPLDPFAPAPVRDALTSLLSLHAGNILHAWQREVTRSGADPLTPFPPDVFTMTLDACMDLLKTGTPHRLEVLFERTAGNGSSTLSTADEAARMHRVLNGLPMAAYTAIRDDCPEDPNWHGQLLSLLLNLTHLGATCLFRMLERTLSAEVEAVQERQLFFFQEITRLATNNRLRLVEPHEIPFPEGTPIPIREAQDGARIRHSASDLARDLRMEHVRVEDLTLAVGEAVSNVLKHAGRGIGHVWHRDGVIYVFLADTGSGITLENLPKALTPGWSSEPSLGMGFTLMLEMADVIWLSTGAFGTTLCIEKSVFPRTDPLLETLLQDDRC